MLKIEGIAPKDISLEKDLSSTFGKTEVEVQAASLIRFAQARDNWNPFKRSQFRDFLGDDYVYLDELEQRNLIENNDDGTYSFTEFLVKESYASHPAKK